MTDKKRIGFSDLTVSLKVAIIAAWFSGIIYVISFLIGLIEGLMIY